MDGDAFTKTVQAVDTLRDCVQGLLASATSTEITQTSKELGLPEATVREWLQPIRQAVTEENVIAALNQLPEGMVTTYSRIAEALGRDPKAGITVGSVLKRAAGIPALGASTLPSKWMQRDGSFKFLASETVTVVDGDSSRESSRADLLKQRGVPVEDLAGGWHRIPPGHLH